MGGGTGRRGSDGAANAIECNIGGTVLMLADEYPDHGFRSPATYGGAPVSLHLYVENVDVVSSCAITAGAQALRPVVDQFYGDRSGTLKDPFGHTWHVATHTEDLTPEEIAKRAPNPTGRSEN